jgi:hypothetical protein
MGIPFRSFCNWFFDLPPAKSIHQRASSGALPGQHLSPVRPPEPYRHPLGSGADTCIFVSAISRRDDLEFPAQLGLLMRSADNAAL